VKTTIKSFVNADEEDNTTVEFVEKNLNPSNKKLLSPNLIQDTAINLNKTNRLNSSAHNHFKGKNMRLETSECSNEQTNYSSDSLLEQPDLIQKSYKNDDTDDKGASPNKILVNFSYSLHSQLRQMARMEGVTVQDIVVELIAEGVTKRAFEDAGRPAPSHLMTRTGYIPPDSNTNLQPTLSHHVNSGNLGNVRPGTVRRFNHSQNPHSNLTFNNQKPYNNKYQNKNRVQGLPISNMQQNKTDQDKESHILGSKRQKDNSRS